ncbi:hypothetical protein ACO1O0_001495 [Amphichorda felina]
MPPDLLSALPVELLEEITSNLISEGDLRHLASLVRTSWCFHRLFNAQLYRRGQHGGWADVQKGEPALLWAARVGRLETIRRAMTVDGVRFDARILTQAVECGQQAVVELLLDAVGMDVNGLDCYECTPLLGAVTQRDTPMVRLLLQHGADVSCKACQPVSGVNKFPIDAAVKARQVEMTDMLLKAGTAGAGTALHTAAAIGHSPLAKLLLAHGVDVNYGGGWTPMHTAISNSHHDMVQLLIDHGADVEVQAHGQGSERDGYAPLLLATNYQMVATIKVLLEKGANVNATHDLHRLTPLTLAYERQADNVVQLLLQHGAKTYDDLTSASR